MAEREEDESFRDALKIVLELAEGHMRNLWGVHEYTHHQPHLAEKRMEQKGAIERVMIEIQKEYLDE